MKTLQNLHVHTTYADGKDRPEEIVLTAIEKGFSSIGFSEHTYMEFSDYPYQMTVEDMRNGFKMSIIIGDPVSKKFRKK